MFGFGKSRIFVLSVDGGGIRGIIPAMILQHLEQRLKEAGVDKPFHRLFDLMAGTSTGSIIVLGLTAPAENRSDAAFSISDILRIYENQGREIFPPARFRSLRTVSQVWTERYDHRPLEGILKEWFGDLTLKDALTNVLVTAFDTEHTKPFLMKSRHFPKGGVTDLNFYMRDAARASSAAPTFFELPYIQALNREDQRFSLIDGGVFANNPALCAYIEARKMFPRAKKYTILSLGTGRASWGYPYEDVKDWGYIDWVRPGKGTPLFRMIMRGQSECVAHHLSRIDEVEYIRLNGLLDNRSELMDDAGERNIQRLKQAAETIIRENEEKLQRIVSLLQRRR